MLSNLIQLFGTTCSPMTKISPTSLWTPINTLLGGVHRQKFKATAMATRNYSKKMLLQSSTRFGLENGPLLLMFALCGLVDLMTVTLLTNTLAKRLTAQPLTFLPSMQLILTEAHQRMDLTAQVYAQQLSMDNAILTPLSSQVKTSAILEAVHTQSSTDTSRDNSCGQ